MQVYNVYSIAEDWENGGPTQYAEYAIIALGCKYRTGTIVLPEDLLQKVENRLARYREGPDEVMPLYNPMTEDSARQDYVELYRKSCEKVNTMLEFGEMSLQDNREGLPN
mgnify:CR=1 FL=1